MSARKPPHEQDRLNKLRSLNVLDPQLDTPLETTVRLVSQITGAPACFLSFIEEDKQIIRQAWGIEISDGARDSRICSETILGVEPYSCSLSNQQRLQITTEDYGDFSFYLGFPLLSDQGYALGTLVILDYAPRVLSATQRASLEGIATHIVSQLELSNKLGSVRRTLASLEDSEQRFRKIADASPVLLWISDEAGNRTLSNTAWCSFTGLTQEQSLAECWRDTLHPQDRAVYRSKWSECVKVQGKFQHEYRLKHSSGSYRWVMEQAIPLFSSNGRLEAYVSSCVDLSLRNSDELQYQHNEARFRAISEAAPLGIVVTDSNGTCIYTNSHFQEISGIPADECLGTGWLRTVDPGDAPTLHSALRDATQNTTPFEMTFRFKPANNTISWCNLKAATINTTDAVSGWVFTVQDITAQRTTEEALVTAKNTAEAAMQAKGQFLANMSHEIRTPLTAIIGFADALYDEPLTAQQLHTVDIIRNNGKHLLSIINQILDLAKIDAGALSIRPTCTSILTLLEEIKLMFSPTVAEKGLAFQVDFDESIPGLLMLDKLRLKQIIINLVSNAIKFTKKGSVSITARWDDNDQYLSLDVSDTGIGIDAQAASHIFEPFAQANESTTRAYGGTGLGLSISKMLATGMSGDLTVSSTPGLGTQFHLSIKAPQASPSEVSTHKRQRERKRRIRARQEPLKGRVLFADDALDNRRLVEHLLRKLGANVTLVKDGREALEIVRKETFDLILMDVQMPTMDGLTATKKIRESGVTTPIVAVSAGAMSSDIEQALSAGCEMHLSKPFEQADLLKILQRYLARSASNSSHEETTIIKDPELESLIKEFASNLHHRILPIRERIDQGALEEASALAHKLKGSAGMYRFSEVSKLAGALDTACKNGDKESAQSLAEKLTTCVNDLQETNEQGSATS